MVAMWHLQHSDYKPLTKPYYWFDEELKINRLTDF